jgi:hypothetical protein
MNRTTSEWECLTALHMRPEKNKRDRLGLIDKGQNQKCQIHSNNDDMTNSTRFKRRHKHTTPRTLTRLSTSKTRFSGASSSSSSKAAPRVARIPVRNPLLPRRDTHHELSPKRQCESHHPERIRPAVGQIKTKEELPRCSGESKWRGGSFAEFEAYL